MEWWNNYVSEFKANPIFFLLAQAEPNHAINTYIGSKL